MSLGRNFDEIYRALIAVQTTDEFSVAMPADGQPGEDAIVPPAGSFGTANERTEAKNGEMEYTDWFFCTKKLKKQEVLEAVLQN